MNYTVETLGREHFPFLLRFLQIRQVKTFEERGDFPMVSLLDSSVRSDSYERAFVATGRRLIQIDSMDAAEESGVLGKKGFRFLSRCLIDSHDLLLVVGYE